MKDDQLVKQAIKLVIAMDKTVDDNLPQKIAGIVKNHSKGAAIAALFPAWIPGIGATIATLISAGFIWAMYSRIGTEINLPISKNIVKTLVSGAVTNVSASVIGAFVLSTAISFIPGLNLFATTVIMGVTCYGLTLSSGYVYLKVMTRFFNKNK